MVALEPWRRHPWKALYEAAVSMQATPARSAAPGTTVESATLLEMLTAESRTLSPSMAVQRLRLLLEGEAEVPKPEARTRRNSICRQAHLRPWQVPSPKPPAR